MGIIKQFILELDLFGHPQLLRYRQQPSYRTVTGGIVSVLLVALFAGIFASLVINTFQNNIIVSSTSVSYDSDPAQSDLTTSINNRFMFAVGIVGLDLSSSTHRYFDIGLEAISVVNNTKNTTKVALSPCKLSQWSGVTDQITSSYNSLKFGEWLCPPDGFTFPLQGKKTSNAFKYGKLTVYKCGTIFSASTCANQTVIDDFISVNQGVIVNYYYINPNVNAGDNQYLNYYLEDSNYFSFDTSTGVNANLFYSDFTIQTDRAILPYNDYSNDQGLMTTAPANIQTYTVNSKNQYAKIYLRKAGQKSAISRSYQKLDQTLSYIGGLLGTVILLMTFMSIYSKFCYEIEFGDKLFKKNHDGSYGSQNFNFIVYLGYGFFNILTMFGIVLNWNTMKRYHQCRIQTLKQLDIELLFKKIEYFQEVSKIVLDDHHLKGIHMLPKKKFNDVRKNRKRFLLQSLMYYNLDRKARDVHVEDSQYQKRNQQFLKEKRQGIIDEIVREQQNEDIRNLQLECAQSFKILNDQSKKGDKFSQKIIEKMYIADIVSAIMRMTSNGPDSKVNKRKDNNVTDVLPSAGHILHKDEDDIAPSNPILFSDILRMNLGPRQNEENKGSK